jgi:hypothetical protein
VSANTIGALFRTIPRFSFDEKLLLRAQAAKTGF